MFRPCWWKKDRGFLVGDNTNKGGAGKGGEHQQEREGGIARRAREYYAFYFSFTLYFEF